MAYAYNGILMDNKKLNSDSYYNVAKPWKYYAKSKRQDTKNYKFYVGMFWNIQNRQVYRDTE